MHVKLFSIDKRYDKSKIDRGNSMILFTWLPLLTCDLNWLYPTLTNGIRRPLLPLYVSCGYINRRRKAMTHAATLRNLTVTSKPLTWAALWWLVTRDVWISEFWVCIPFMFSALYLRSCRHHQKH